MMVFNLRFRTPPPPPSLNVELTGGSGIEYGALIFYGGGWGARVYGMYGSLGGWIMEGIRDGDVGEWVVG
jgi:hypothetical protein